jgi:hypothetical protein
VAAPSALAVTGAVDKPCYTHIPTQGSEPITVTLTGGTPGADFLVAATDPGKGTGSAGSASGTFDATGNGTTQIVNVFPPSGSINPLKGQAVQISAADYGAGGVDTPIATATITNLALKVSSTPSNPRRARTVTVSGTPFANQRLYGFITKPSSTKVLRRVALGPANACGYVSHKAVVAPASYRAGSYRMYVNAGTKLDKPHAIWLEFRITRRYL